MAHSVTLTVRSARGDDVYRDIARIGQSDRGALRTGRVHVFRVNGKGHSMILRGVTKQYAGFILIDEETRRRLGVDYGQSYEFQIAELGFFKELWWGWTAIDPAYRASSRVSVISLGLGILSFMLGLVSLWLGYLALK